jgi:hypothetical protein
MNKYSQVTSNASSVKNTVIFTTKADEVAITFKDFKDAIIGFTISAKENKNFSSNITKKNLKDQLDIVILTTSRFEDALKNFYNLKKIYTSDDEKNKEMLRNFKRQLQEFRIYMLPRLKTELSKKVPVFTYKAHIKNTFPQNLRNNITMRKTKPKNTKDQATGQLKPIEYISFANLDRLLEEVLPKRSYNKINPNNTALAAANVEGPVDLFKNTDGGRRKTYKRRQ